MPRSIRITTPPDGFLYRKGVISEDEERRLCDVIGTLPLREFEFRGYTGKRRVISYGNKYDFVSESLRPADPIPDFLLDVRDVAASFAQVNASDLSQVLVTEYDAGTTIGWHRDKDVFEDVIGVSLLSRCVFRLRRKAGSAWERYAHLLEPRSIYLLRGAVRNDWEHSIPPVDEKRYSITFRSRRTRR